MSDAAYPLNSAQGNVTTVIECPFCNAPPYVPCFTSGAAERKRPHLDRVKAWLERRENEMGGGEPLLSTIVQTGLTDNSGPGNLSILPGQKE